MMCQLLQCTFFFVHWAFSLKVWKIYCLIWCTKIDAAKMLSANMMLFDIFHPLFFPFVSLDLIKPTHPPSIHEHYCANQEAKAFFWIPSHFSHHLSIKKRNMKYTFLQSVWDSTIRDDETIEIQSSLVGCLQFEHEFFFM